MAKHTITFDEKVKGWTSFHSYEPEWMIGMNNDFFSFNDGNLHMHNSEDVPRNTFYNVQYPSKVSIMVNDNPSDIKELQAISLEGNYPWNTELIAFVNMTDNSIDSSILETEYVEKEGIWYAFARRNESETHYDSKSSYGVGQVLTVTPTIVTISGTSALSTAGDMIVKGNDLTDIGEIINISTVNGITTIELADTTGLTIGDFILGKKNARVEGGNLRGYVIKIDLDITQNDKVELFAVNSEVIKSYS